MGSLQSTAAAAVCGLGLRSVTGLDIPAIGMMWDRCSLTTRIARFHAPVRDIPAAYLTSLLCDPGAHVLAALPAGDVVGLASLIASPASGSPGSGSPGSGSPGSGSPASGSPASRTGELGVLVEDAWQRRGIGRRLVARLICAAPARGITTLTACVLAANPEVAGLLRQVPGQYSISRDGEVLDVRVRLLAADPPIRGPHGTEYLPKRSAFPADPP